jgi:hypothetical protein
MVIGQSLKPFLDHALQTMINVNITARSNAAAFDANRPTVIALFADIGISTSPYHTGVMLLSRKKSRALLTRWASDIGSGQYTRDQRALVASVEA